MRILKGLANRSRGSRRGVCLPKRYDTRTRNKVKGKLLAADPKGGRRALPRKGLALAGDYADVLNACLPHLIAYGGDIAILSSSVGVDEDRRTGAFF